MFTLPRSSILHSVAAREMITSQFYSSFYMLLSHFISSFQFLSPSPTPVAGQCARPLLFMSIPVAVRQMAGSLVFSSYMSLSHFPSSSHCSPHSLTPVVGKGFHFLFIYFFLQRDYHCTVVILFIHVLFLLSYIYPSSDPHLLLPLPLRLLLLSSKVFTPPRPLLSSQFTNAPFSFPSFAYSAVDTYV